MEACCFVCIAWTLKNENRFLNYLYTLKTLKWKNSKIYTLHKIFRQYKTQWESESTPRSHLLGRTMCYTVFSDFSVWIYKYTHDRKKMLFKPPCPHCLLRKRSPDNWRDLCLLCEFQLRKCKLEGAGTLRRDWETGEGPRQSSVVGVTGVVDVAEVALSVCPEWLV